MNQQRSTSEAPMSYFVLHRAAATVFASATLVSTLAACEPDERCPGDLEYDRTLAVCAATGMKAADGDEESAGGGARDDAERDDAEPDGGMAAGDGDGDGDGATVDFGSTCTEDADCGPGICVNAPIPIGCTQRDCMAGEDNAGVCPSDWMCLSSPSTGHSACVKL